MELTVNGEREQFEEESLPLLKLLEHKEVKMPEMVSVELNGEFLNRDDFEKTVLKQDDTVEFLYFMGGG